MQNTFSTRTHTAAVALLLALGVSACVSNDNNVKDQLREVDTRTLPAATNGETEKAKKAQEAKKAEEAKLAQEAKKAEEAKLAQEAKKAEEAKLAQEAKKAEEAKLAEEAKKAEEAKLAQEAKKAEEAKLAEEAKKAEEAKLAQEAKKAEEAKLAQEAKKAEEAKLAQEAKTAEEAKLAEEAKKAEEAKLAEEARQAEEAKQAEEARQAEEAKKAEEEKQRLDNEQKAKADAIVGSLLSKSFAQTGSASYQKLNDPDERKKLNETLVNNSSTCKSQTGTKCVTSAQKGDVIFSDYQSYSGYAIIREQSGLDNSPANAYVAVVNTPTKDKEAVVNATYTGNAVYSTKNSNAYAGYTAKGYNAVLTLNVENGVVSGEIAGNTGKKATIVTFNPSEIQVGNQGVVFEGKAVFNTAAPLGLNVKDENGVKLSSLDGSYKGQFAGQNAEEVVGTFETDSTEKAQSVQGAFMGKKP